MFCVQCGSEMLGQFCGKCGTARAEDGIAPSQPTFTVPIHAPAHVSHVARSRGPGALASGLRWLILPLSAGYVYYVYDRFYTLRPLVVLAGGSSDEMQQRALQMLYKVIEQSAPVYLGACLFLFLLWFAVSGKG